MLEALEPCSSSTMFLKCARTSTSSTSVLEVLVLFCERCQHFIEILLDKNCLCAAIKVAQLYKMIKLKGWSARNPAL